MSDDITILDVTDPEELADELESFAERYLRQTGDHENVGTMQAAADWLRHLSEEAQK